MLQLICSSSHGDVQAEPAKLFSQTAGVRAVAGMAAPSSAPLCRGEVRGGFSWTGKAFAPGEWRDYGYQGLELPEQMDMQCGAGNESFTTSRPLEMFLDPPSPGQG